MTQGAGCSFPEDGKTVTSKVLHADAKKEASAGLKGIKKKAKKVQLEVSKARKPKIGRVFLWTAGLDENNELNEKWAPSSGNLPNYHKWGLVSEWILVLFPNVWKHVVAVAAVQRSSEGLGDNDEVFEQQPWVLLCKGDRNFAIVKTKEVGPEGWDLMQVRRTHVPIPADIYEEDYWWEKAPSPRKAQGRKQPRSTSCIDSDEEDILEDSNQPKKCKMSSQGKQPDRGSSDHEEEDVIIIGADTEDMLPEPEHILQSIGDALLTRTRPLCQSPGLTPPLFLEDEYTPKCSPPPTAPMASTSLRRPSNINPTLQKATFTAFSPGHLSDDPWDECISLGTISF
ncbi:hypothetical protein K439DRAFT_1625623 [Ramaria rubella]|nr:hypothetical protein K439DRAFT_1625623 [Ramaria rubella]